MKSAFLKDIFREIGKSKSRFFSIFAIIALGAGFFTGLKITCPDMIITQEHYFENQNLMDIRLVSTLGFDEKDISAINEIEGIREIYPSYSKDVFVENDIGAGIVAKLMAFPDSGMNEVVLLEGRLPENPEECVVEKHSQLAVVKEIGDTVSVYTTDKDDPIEDSLERSEWKVVGIVMSPQYIAYDRGTATIGDGSTDTYIMVPEENFNLEVYSEVYLTLDSTNGVPAFDDEYSAAVEVASEVFEELGEKRAPLRLDEIKTEAYAEINDAKAEIADAEKKLADAEQELADALIELEDGEKEIKDGWAEYYDGYQEYLDGKAEFEEEISKAEKEIEDGVRNIRAGNKAYEKGYNQYLDGKNLFDASLEASGMTVEGLYENRVLLENTIDKMGSMGMDTSRLEENLASLNMAIGTYEQLETSREQLEAAKKELEDGGRELHKGREELNEAKEEGLKELSDAKKELDDAYIELKDAEKDLAEGWEEYYDGLAEFEEEKADAEIEIADAKIEIADAEKELEDLNNPEWYIFTRDDNPGYSSYESDVYIIESVGKVFPIFFLLVAMLVCLTTMTRMVEEQRTQIGTMKALGYGKGSILAKFIIYSSFASLSGSAFGIALCSYVFPTIIYSAYAMRYIIPPLEMVTMPGTWALVTVICILCTSFAVVLAGYAELRESPAELMRPKAPKAGKRVLLERVTFIWKRLSFTRKVTVRNLFRYKKRIFMTILGIAGCAALTLTGLGILSSISVILEKQYSELFNYDLIVSLDTDSDEKSISEVLDELERNPISEKNIPLHMMSAKYEGLGNISLVVAKDPDELSEMILFRNMKTGEIYELSDEGVIITQRFSEKYDISAGDEITFYSDDREFNTKVTAVSENYAMHFIYMTDALYEEIRGEAPETNAVLTIMSDNGEKAQDELANTLTELEGVLALTFSRTTMETFNDTVENLNYVVILIIVCAAALAFVVLYNLTNINITERIREIATIKVLGFYDREVSAYVFRENIILSLMGALAGLLLGVWLHGFVLNAIQTDDITFGRELPFWTFAMAFVMTGFFSVLVNWIMFFRLKKISMVESLKSVE